MNMQRNSLVSSSLNKNVSLVKSSPIAKSKYTVKFANKLASVNIELARFTNYVSWSQPKTIEEIKSIKRYDGANLVIDNSILCLPEDENNHFLVSNYEKNVHKTHGLSVLRYEVVHKKCEKICKIEDVRKLNIKKSKHRVYVYLDEKQKEMTILYLDPHHLLAQKVEDNEYEIHKNNTINIIDIK